MPKDQYVRRRKKSYNLGNIGAGNNPKSECHPSSTITFKVNILQELYLNRYLSHITILFSLGGRGVGLMKTR